MSILLHPFFLYIVSICLVVFGLTIFGVRCWDNGPRLGFHWHIVALGLGLMAGFLIR